ncbi:MAG: tRNA preQ1(34) S-adenosylmethionine ribosyltransferase-isomerase QueA [Planctomycetes bacterium]|nr:tRNA preQ1(34) S-adenosylmethionine ribosyltransferase-isomerase QueA [Planctomycetota bacterium]
MRVDDFDFPLPEERIARQPADPRDSARLLVLERASERREHRVFRDLPEYLRAGDLLVLNDTRVLPNRLVGSRSGGGRAEALILERQGQECRGFLRPAARVRTGETLSFESGALLLTLTDRLPEGQVRFRLEARDGDLDGTLDRVGRAPLPPYLHRDGSEDARADRERYQTVFAERPGAVAAPTAGLHFTPALLRRIADMGVEIATVTLHVGLGTFAPIRVERVDEHRMHAERYEVSQSAAEAVVEARRRGGRVVAVGTTAVRTLETVARPGRQIAAGSGDSELFLCPGRSFRVVDAMVTNFHLPRSTLFMLVCAFAGRERMLQVYREAIEQEYRFYSFGDAMLIL